MVEYTQELKEEIAKRYNLGLSNFEISDSLSFLGYDIEPHNISYHVRKMIKEGILEKKERTPKCDNKSEYYAKKVNALINSSEYYVSQLNALKDKLNRSKTYKGHKILARYSHYIVLDYKNYRVSKTYSDILKEG